MLWQRSSCCELGVLLLEAGGSVLDWAWLGKECYCKPFVRMISDKASRYKVNGVSCVARAAGCRQPVVVVISSLGLCSFEGIPCYQGSFLNDQGRLAFQHGNLSFVFSMMKTHHTLMHRCESVKQETSLCCLITCAHACATTECV